MLKFKTMKLKYYLILFLLFLLFLIFFSSCVKENNLTEENLVYKNFTIKGSSMKPALNNSQEVRVLLNSTNYSRGEIVIFKVKTRDEIFVKRIIAIEEDKVLFGRNGKIYLNGIVLNESYVKDIEFNSNNIYVLLKQLEYYNNTIPRGYFLIMGDNRRFSLDSSEYGLVLRENVLGKVITN